MSVQESPLESSKVKFVKDILRSFFPYIDNRVLQLADQSVHPSIPPFLLNSINQEKYIKIKEVLEKPFHAIKTQTPSRVA